MNEVERSERMNEREGNSPVSTLERVISFLYKAKKSFPFIPQSSEAATNHD